MLLDVYTGVTVSKNALFKLQRGTIYNYVRAVGKSNKVADVHNA